MSFKNSSKIYDYKGHKIQNIPYGSEPRWFIYDEEMKRINTYPKATLKKAKEYIDALNKSKEERPCKQ